MRTYALLGSNIQKSLSKLIHNEIAKYHDINYDYELINISNVDELKSALADDKYSGYNVTMPFKTYCLDYIDALSISSKKCGALNTIKKTNGLIEGFNTDGIGFVKSLEYHSVDVKDKRVLVYGSGGVARSIISELLDKGVKSIMIVARNSREKYEIYKVFRPIAKDKIILLDTYYGLVCDIAINTTPVGAFDNDDLSIDINAMTAKFVADVVYLPFKTRLLRVADELGVDYIGGIDMLILQAYYSFCIWNDMNYCDKNAKSLLEIIKAKL